MVTEITIATDGSSLGNPGPAGWAWVASDGRSNCAGARHSTNNRMELRAVIEALEAMPERSEIRILSDSEYVVKIFTEWLGAWRAKGMRTGRGKPVENRDLIERLDALVQSRNVRFEWVRGHAGHPMNEQADALANDAAQKPKGKLAARREGDGDGIG